VKNDYYVETESGANNSFTRKAEAVKFAYQNGGGKIYTNYTESDNDPEFETVDGVSLEEIVAELDRLGLSPIPNEQEGVDAFPVTTPFRPDLVVLADSTEECLNRAEVLAALKRIRSTKGLDEREVYERYGFEIQDLEETEVVYADDQEYSLKVVHLSE
jgi:hypothetical protein